MVKNVSPKSLTAIRERLQKTKPKKPKITKDMIVAELAKIAFYDITKIMTWNETATFNPSTMIDDDTAAAISEVTTTRDGIKIKMYDKKAALMDLAKMLGYVNDKQDTSEANDKAFNIQKIEHVIIDKKCSL